MEKDKRLVLHSNTDVVQEINKLRMELTNQKSEIQNLTAALNDQKIYFTSKLLQKDTEIQTLQSDHKATVDNLTAQMSTLQKTITSQATNTRGILI